VNPNPKKMTKYKIEIQYEGTRYAGWQVQPDALSIQEEIETTLAKFLRETVKVVGSGRTDAGVHALGQVAHFRTKESIDQTHFLKAANGLLPRDIRILTIQEVDDSFHAQKSAKRKIYHYHLWLEPVQSPFARFTTTYVRTPLDLDLMRQGAAKFLGTHDFSAFANQQNEGAAGKNPVRILYRLDLVEQEGGIRLEFEGNGFLYKMVRNIVGTLLEVASGKRVLSDIDEGFARKDRRFTGKAAPPTGLILVKVFYE